MATWNVSMGGPTITVEAANWLGALGAALPQLGVPAGALARLVCSLGADGSAQAVDPQTGARITLSPVAVAAPPPLVMPMSSLASMYATVEPTPAPPAPSAPSGDVTLESVDFDEDFAEEPTPPAPVAPRARPLEDRMFVVFDRCAEIAAAGNVTQACQTALGLLSDLVPADAGAVLVRTRTGDSLKFTAAFGPRANRIVETTIPVDQGIAGFSHNFGMGLVIEDVRRDARHYSRVDRASGYRTQAILAVPLKGDGISWGCMELLNPPSGFDAEDLEVAQLVAGSLAAWLQQALG